MTVVMLFQAAICIIICKPNPWDALESNPVKVEKMKLPSALIAISEHIEEMKLTQVDACNKCDKSHLSRIRISLIMLKK